MKSSANINNLPIDVYPALSDAKKLINEATSSGWPKRQQEWNPDIFGVHLLVELRSFWFQ